MKSAWDRTEAVETLRKGELQLNENTARMK
jgi:hypothetical protein